MRNRRLAAVAALAASGLLACGGASSPDELAEEVFGTLQDRDFKALVDESIATPQQVAEVCPGATEYRVDSSEHAKHFDECLARFDFRSAEYKQARPTTGLAANCGAQVASAHDIEITVAKGSALYTFRIESALETNDGWKMTGHLKCPELKN